MNNLRHTYDTHVISSPPNGGWWSGLNDDDGGSWQGPVMERCWVRTPRPGSCPPEPGGQGSACINKQQGVDEEVCGHRRRQVSVLDIGARGQKVKGER